MSQTYLCGEKYISPDEYETGALASDNQGWSVGYDSDINCRVDSDYPPQQDQAGLNIINNFGSAHSNGFQMAMCDGSVHMIAYAITPQIHVYLGNRQDGAGLDGKEW